MVFNPLWISFYLYRMKRYGQFAMCAALCLCTVFPMCGQQAQAPFAIQLEDITYDTWPGLHSFAWGTAGGDWFFFCGRMNGMHDIIPPDPFPAASANQQIFMLDPQSGSQWSADIYDLPLAMASQLRSTNPEYFQSGDFLYIMGGYGKDSLSGLFTTFSSLLAVNLDTLRTAMLAGSSIAPAFRQVHDTLFCVTGGEAKLLNDTVYFFGGQVFTGIYTHPATSSFTQAYTNRLLKFHLDDDGINITLSGTEVLTDTVHFHRRDLNLVPVYFPGTGMGLGAFAGVFQYDGDWPFYHPVYMGPWGYDCDTAFSQLFNAYSCPVLAMYDSLSMDYYATFFGGISRFYYDEDADTVKEDLNIPFVNDISTVTCHATGTTEQAVLPVHFNTLLGANAVFIPGDSIPRYANGVFKLAGLHGTVFAGYIFGGIHPDAANYTFGTASNYLFRVYVVITPETGIAQDLPLSGCSVFPNPSDGICTVRNTGSAAIGALELLNMEGAVVWQSRVSLPSGQSLQINLGAHARGMYLLRAFTGAGNAAATLLLQ